MFNLKSAAAVFLMLLATVAGDAHGAVSPWSENPHYLAWDGTPVFPLGPANIHAWYPISRPAEVDIAEHLGRLAKVIEEIGSPHVCGFVRCLTYDPAGGPDILLPWVKTEDGRYDLERFEPAWEKRLREYLDTALKHRIVVSLEIWDDWSVTRGPGGARNPEGSAWNINAFNPLNNINYDESVLPVATRSCNPPFYDTIPSLGNNEQVFTLQKHFVDRLLSIASDYPHVMINLSNESRATLEWSRFWARYIRERVPESMMIGEMPSTNRRDGGGECHHEFNPLTLCTDPLYDYVDIAQGVSRHEFGSPRQQALRGGERIRQYRKAMADAGTIRPLVVSKDYTNDANGGDAVLWSRFVGGASTARFHRPYGEDAEHVVAFQHEAVGRLGAFIATVPFWRMKPAPDLVTTLPQGAGVNVLADPNTHCVIQLFDGAAGEKLLVNLPAGAWAVRWLDPATGNDLENATIDAGEQGIELTIPEGPGHRVVHLKKQ